MDFHPDTSWSQYIHKINADSFQDIALSLFAYQYQKNDLYRNYAEALGIRPEQVRKPEDIPFLPVGFFKTHTVLTNAKTEPAICFESSGTTGEQTSRHHILHPELYHQSLLHGFRSFYGEPKDYAILALLPSYLERRNASLVHMAEVLMAESGHPANGSYLNEWNKLRDTLETLEAAGQKTLLLGVTFALLDFAAAHPMSLKHTIVMETGGMKGRRQELTRDAVHEYLKQQWQLNAVHSEYGMTELLSQAYARANGVFQPSPTMRVLVRELNDPLSTAEIGTGCLNIIDLANVGSCAFIATEDIGIVAANGSFQVLGRMDHSTLRGCSLMTA